MSPSRDPAEAAENNVKTATAFRSVACSGAKRDSAAVRNKVVTQVRMSPEASATAEPVRIARSAVSGRMMYSSGNRERSRYSYLLKVNCTL
jgi:hypothetical protein